MSGRSDFGKIIKASKVLELSGKCDGIRVELAETVVERNDVTGR